MFDSKSTLIAAAAIVGSRGVSDQQDQTDVNVMFSQDCNLQWHVPTNPSQTVQELLQAVHTNEGHPSTESHECMTIILAPPKVDLQRFADDALAKRDPSRTIVAAIGADDGVQILNSSLSKNSKTWSAHRVLSVFTSLRAVASDTTLRALPTVSPNEQELLLKWSTSSEAGIHTSSQLIHHYFERVSQENPSSIALQLEDRISITYEELNRRSDNLASYLVHDLGVSHHDIVLMFFDKGVEMIIAILAILKAGAAYVPLDIDHPEERMRAIQSSVRSKLCLTASDVVHTAGSRLQSDDGVKVVAIDEYFASPLASVPRALPAHVATGDDVCYIMFTSGTTGEPKGVVVSHSSVVSSIINGPESNQSLRLEGSKLRTLAFSNYAFDYSIWDIYLTLTSGGCLCIAPKLAMLNDLEAILNSMSITFLETTPTVLSLIDPARIPTLAVVYSSGEALTQAVRDKFQPDVAGRPLRLGNGGAPTETTVMSVFTTISKDDDPRTFGKPFGDNRVYILDEDIQLCPPGAIGRLWIGGQQVSKGYFGRPDLTDKSYRENPFHSSETVERMFNTGDLCLWGKDGRLLHLGRADRQVKIRGQRIETSEIEGALRGSAGVKDAYVIKRLHGGRDELFAFIINQTENPNVEALKHNLALRLPSYMIPAAFMSIPSLPLTSNGKIDQRALEILALNFERRSPSDNKHVESNLPILQSAVGQLVISAWSSVLQISSNDVLVDCDFLKCGGDSISAIRVAGACRAAGYPLTIMDFDLARTVQAQVALLTERGPSAARASGTYKSFELLASEEHVTKVLDETSAHGYPRDGIEDAYPCTAYISGLISLTATDPQSYMANYTFEKLGSFDAAYMQAAWRAVVRRHPILRTAAIITPSPYNDIVHAVVADSAFNLDWTYHTFKDENTYSAGVEDYLKQSPGFVMGRVPTRVALLEGPISSTLCWQMHHSQYDGWSFPRILEDLQAAYATCSGTPEASLTAETPFSHFVRWTKQQNSEKALQYWSDHMKDALPCSWPKVPREAVAPSTDQIQISTWSRGADLSNLCAEKLVTMSDFVRSSLGLVLGMHSGSDDVTFGVVTSGRAGDLEGIENIIGSCIGTYPCRVQLPPTLSAELLLRSVHEQSTTSIPFQCVGLSDISHKLQSSNPFKVLLTIENIPGLHDAEHPFLGRNLRGHQLQMNYPLTVTVFPSADRSELRFQFEWDSRYLSSKDICWFSNHLFSVFDAILDEPARLIADLNVVNDEEETFLRTMGVGLQPEPTLPAVSHLFFHTLVDEIATRNPSALAIEQFGGEQVSYATLMDRANRAAHALQSRGVGPEIMVPVLFDKFAGQVETVISFLAVLKAGGAFVPLDSSWPADRLADCIEQTKSTFVITEFIAADLKEALPVDVLVSSLHELSEGGKVTSTTPLTPGLEGGSLSYVIFTSGSTGKPKGVMVEQANIVAYIANYSTIFPITSAQRLLHFSPWSFDQGLADFFLALSYGATIVLAKMDDLLSNLSGIVKSSCADYAVLTPAICHLLQAEEEYPHLKTLVLGGEKLPWNLSCRWRDRLILVDGYGPTEVTVHCIGANHSAGTLPTPGVIGNPLGTTRAYILDTNLRAVPVGAVGELYLAGAQVTRGYLNLPEKTAEVFLADPFHPTERMYRSGDLARWTSDGLVEYLGRQDGAFVKLRGLRISLSEIEAALMSVSGTAAVVLLIEYSETPQLLAFVSKVIAPAGEATLALTSDLEGAQPWVAELLSACQRTLPSYAVPPLWLPLEAMPQASSGKLDRKQLRKFYDHVNLQPDQVGTVTRTLLSASAARPARAPEGIYENTLLDLWKQVLGKADISVYDNWTDLGGDSIKTIILLSKMKQQFGYNLSLQEFYKEKTIASNASILASRSSGSNFERPSADSVVSNGLVVQIKEGLPRDVGHTSLWFMHPAAGFFGSQYGLMEPLGRDVFGIANTVTEQEVLERDFPNLESYIAQYLPLMPPEPVFIAGHSGGGVLAVMLAAARVAAGLPVKGVILLDTFDTEGFSINPNPHKDAMLPITNTLPAMHAQHTLRVLPGFVTPYCNVPVLLIRALQQVEEVLSTWIIPPSKAPTMERNFWPIDKLPSVDIVILEDAHHFQLIRDPPTRQKVSEVIREWCGRHDATDN